MATARTTSARWTQIAEHPATRLTAHLAALLPLALWIERIVRDALGADPIAELTHASGLWALRFLLASLAMTPLRRLLGQAWPIRYRRMLGLYAFFYACLHLSVYLLLDLGGYWAQIFEDVVKRPYMTVGFLAWLILLPLAATSTRAAMRGLGRRWGLLHRSVYAAAILAALHFLWLVKTDYREPAIYAGVLALLLLARLKRRAAPLKA